MVDGSVAEIAPCCHVRKATVTALPLTVIIVEGKVGTEWHRRLRRTFLRGPERRQARWKGAVPGVSAIVRRLP
jgi:hypothetical protein